MKVLFAVSNENISNSIIKKYQQMYKEIISSKNVYYFNAILKELQKDKSYDRIVISEDLEPFSNNNFDAIDNFIFDKLDSISDEASNNVGEDIPIILITTDRRNKSDSILAKLFGIGVYSALIGQDRSIDQVCKLINKPRTKKESKAYYHLEANDSTSYVPPEGESDVSELEIQNILNHYKRLGKNEDRYVESFNSIATQYTDAQLKVIIKFLPLNVKAVLEEKCQRYQKLVSFTGGTGAKKNYEQSVKIKKEDKSGIKIESILDTKKDSRPTKPVIIPSTVSTKNVKKVESQSANIKTEVKEPVKQTVIPQQETPKVIPQEVKPKAVAQEIIEEPVEETKKRRGRPKKVQESVQEEPKTEETKKRRGRPKKNKEEDVAVLPGIDDEEETMLPLVEEEEETVSPFDLTDEDDEEQETISPFDLTDEDDEEETEEEPVSLFDLDNEEEQEDEETEVDNEEVEDEEEPILSNQSNRLQDNMTAQTNNNQYQRKSAYEDLINNPVTVFSQSTENLLTKDKKIVAFVGTSKNGTSFLVNNTAELLASQGIRTAILDLTKNKNAYYIYTKNEEELRKTAFECMGKLQQGVAEGIKVNKSLDVYTCLPGEGNYEGQSEMILKTLVQNYSLVIIDCDFDTEYAYLGQAQEIYLVQSMDVLTIQPLTAYLRDLKAKGVLQQDKLRVVINKSMRIKSVTERAIIGGMAFYNDPAMSFMTELFNRETVKYISIPFDVQTYGKYLECIVNCSVTLNGYSKEFMASLRKLAGMVYPLIDSKSKPSGYNNYNSNFSNSMDSTLNKMKGSY